ncbi:WXG100 family type VII secretion target [Streptomyces sp. TRM68367]|uniref:WXG100 family type VII secretion target n=1 Tax=Streptomyces sp. TRM68367 TaxID=2758415 RepID=UPI00165AEFE7|nr:WXG100 family type VII secretion target [Streptomyces sp. TRM68367]MBC9730527.1 WXG100 family type VII secretion target [Streptomyces sp. TRM68367]
MSTYSLTFTELENAVTSMGQISQQIEDFLTELQTGTMQAILEWESVARDEFDQQRAVWGQAAKDMATQAVQAQAALDNIVGCYGDGERAGQKIWAR